MQHVKMYGASDDLVEVEGIIGGDEFNGDHIRLSVGGILGVEFKYGEHAATWGASFFQLDEDLRIPDDWTITLSQSERGHSVQVNMEVPDNVSVVRMYIDEKPY